MKIALVLIALVCVVFAIEERVLVVQVKHTSHEDALFALLSEKKILPQPVLPTSYKLRAAQYKSSKSYSELSRYYTINLSQVSGDVNAIQDELLSKDFISAAYFKPVGSLAVYEVPTVSQPLIPQAEKTPSFVKRQTYLDGPGGFNVSAVSKVPGARGTDVTLVDIEGSWIWEHEDLIDKKGKTLFGKTIDSSMWWNHGTAVLGVVAGVDNDFGVTGIAPETAVFGAPYNQSTGLNIAQVVLKAKEFVRAGDIILIELHAPSHRGYTAMEWFPDNAEAFKLVTDDGVIIVEAAGNGNQDFDDPIFDKPMKGFPDTWKNPFRRKEIDSGAILVGAGAPPIGTHGKDHGPDRSRLGFSNYGSCVDVQGWGREVTTMGYGDLYGGDTKTHYTDQFSGTSSASPCVVGVVASIQGITKAAGKPVLTPKTVRELLRKTGKPQVDAPGRPKSQRIGTRPDLGELYEELVKNNFFAK